MDKKKIVGKGLNWQAIVIEEAETDIKVLVKKNLLGQLTYRKAKVKASARIDKAVNELESETLKKEARRSLWEFFGKLYLVMLVSLGIQFSSLKTAYGYVKKGTDFEEVTKRYSKIEYTEELELPTGNIGTPLGEWDRDYSKKVKKALTQLTNQVAKYDEHISLRNIAEMTVRYEGALQNIADLKAQGVNLVQSSRHANCSKRCEPWQGGYYTLDDTYQVVDGIQFQPLSNATQATTTTKSGKTYVNGHITGYNCRHKLFPYRKGYKQPMISEQEINRQREIDRTMREFERNIRHYKEQALMFKEEDPDKAKNARAIARTLNNKYIEYAKSKKRAYYPSRTEIF